MAGHEPRKKGLPKSGRGRSALIGALILVVAVVSVYIAFTSPKGLPFQQHAYAKAAFKDVSGIRPGDEVRIAQVRVGRVNKIELDGDRAVLTMQLDDPRPIYRDATAKVTGRSGLGQEYVDLAPGSPRSGRMAGNDVIPTSQTKGSTQLLDLVQELDARSRVAAGSSLRQLGGGLDGHAQDLRDLVSAAPHELPDLGTVATSLASNNGSDFTSMLRSLDSLSARFDGRQQQISELMDQLGTTMNALDVDGGAPLATSLDEAPSTLASLRRSMQDLQGPLDSTTDAATQLRPGADALATATPDLRGVLREAPKPLNRVPGVAGLAKPALRGLTTVLRDARPIAPKLPAAVQSAATPLNVLAPYAPEISKWFSYATYALNDGDAAGHWLRFTAIPATDAVSGNLPLRDPTTNTDPYPAPGQAPIERAPQGLGTGGGK